jgi:hypothetical protein
LPTPNLIGIGLAFLSLLILFTVDSSNNDQMSVNIYKTETDEWIMQSPSSQLNLVEGVYGSGEIFEELSKKKRRFVGLIFAIFAGLINGSVFTALILEAQREQTNNYFDFVFSFFTGALATSFLYFVAYCFLKKNKTIVYPNLNLPALFSGI